MTDLKFVEVDLTSMQDDGVLWAANQIFFWPFGLALTWQHNKETGVATGLHIRQWDHPEGERERIEGDPTDPIYEERFRRFVSWSNDRLATMLPAERVAAFEMLAREFSERG